jgi:phosphatidylglycerol:prolipoprotein diacylglycerol transferase
MNFLMIIYLLAGFAGAYLGGQQWWKALAVFQPKQIGKLLPLGQRLLLTMVMTAISVGLIALAIVQGSGSNPFTSFFFFFLSTLATLWVITASYFYSHQSLGERYLPMMQTNIMLFIFPAIIFLFLGLEAIEPAFTYPLPKGIPFDQPLVAFYAIFILGGALLAYTLTEREFIKLGKKKGFIEDIFIVAFPAGILGARLWYVWGQWELEFASQPFWKIFAVWEGGLAIMGGALGGALAGILYVYLKRKDVPIIKTLDFAVPTILVAQAIGRWGNFFNQEVYGDPANIEAWMWLPTFIREQMTINGSFRVPLFFIESMINLSGYVVIRFGIGVGLNRYRKQGDLALMYLVWYGLTRGIMEPLRNPIYNMGNTGDWSFIWGWVFFSVGLLAIVINHILLKQKKN